MSAAGVTWLGTGHVRQGMNEAVVLGRSDVCSGTEAAGEGAYSRQDLFVVSKVGMALVAAVDLGSV